MARAAGRIPAGLTALRAVLGPAVLLLALHRHAEPWVVAALTAGLLSDVLDGIIARGLGVATDRLRTADSLVDGLYHLCVGLAVVLTEWSTLDGCRAALGILLAVQVCSYGLDLARYGRIGSFHAYTAKVWGLTLYLAAVALLGFHRGGWVLWTVVAAGAAGIVDAAIIRAVLPGWQRDVPSFVHALRIRRAHDEQTAAR